MDILRKYAFWGTVALLFNISCGSDSETSNDNTSGDLTRGYQDLTTCGNGFLDYYEACDGSKFLTDDGLSKACSDSDPASIRCDAECKESYVACTATDMCEAWGWYGDDFCDPCEDLGGHADPACESSCGANDFCADYYNFGSQEWTCQSRHGVQDPDCDVCGNGVAEDAQWCDGADMHELLCQDFGYAGGTLSCHDDCMLDVSLCTID